MSARPTVGSQRRRFTSIPGFSDQPGLPKLGKLRLGLQTSNNGKSYPKEVDYFVFDPDEGLAPELRKELLDRFKKLYGEKPFSIHPVMFVTPEREEAFSQSLEWWGNNKRLCQGNGDEAERLNKLTGEREPWLPCANSGKCAEWNSGKQCQFITRLRFMLPELTMAGYWQLDTGSKYSSANLRNSINLLQALFGKIHGIPLTLTRSPQLIEYQGKANTHYIVNLFAPNVPRSEMEIVAARPIMQLPQAASIDVEDEDLPEDLVPLEAQQEEPDAELVKKIDDGFEALGTKPADRLIAKNKWKDDLPGLLKEISARVDRQVAEGSL